MLLTSFTNNTILKSSSFYCRAVYINDKDCLVLPIFLLLQIYGLRILANVNKNSTEFYRIRSDDIAATLI